MSTTRFDWEHSIHHIAMEYARRDLDEEIAQGRLCVGDSQACLDRMLETYRKAHAYLVEKSRREDA